MKLKLIANLLTVLCLFASSGAAQSGATFGDGAPTDLDLERLNGKVKKIDEEIARVKIKNGVSREDSPSRSRSVAFDKNGLKTYEWIKFAEAMPYERYYEYENGRRLTRTVSTGFSVGSDKQLESFSVAALLFNVGELSLLEAVFSGRNPEIKSALRQQNKFLFDRRKRLVGEISYDVTTGKPLILTKYIFGEERLPVERQIGSAYVNRYVQSIRYSYVLDEEGNWTKQSAENFPAVANPVKETTITYRKISYYK